MGVRTCLAFLAISFLNFEAIPAYAGDLPPAAGRELQEILSTTAFQPRGVEKSVWERLRDRVLTEMSAKVKEFFSHLNFSKLKLRDDSPWVRILRTIAGFFEASLLWFSRNAKFILYACLTAMSCYLLVILYQKFLKDKINGEPVVATEAAGGNSTEDSARLLQHALRSGRALETLISLRVHLREVFSVKYSLSTSLTDRELCRVLTTEENSRGIFNSVAALFERTVFAKQPLDNEQLQAAIEEYLHLNPSLRS